MRKFLTSIMVAGIAALVLGAGTWAYFSDTESSTGNTMAAGTLDLKVNGQDDPNIVPFTLSNLKPGDQGVELINLANAGSVRGGLQMTGAVSEAGGNTPEPEPLPDNGELAENVNVEMWVQGAGAPFWTGTLAELVGMFVPGQLILEAGDNKTVELRWNVPGTVGNQIMDDRATLNIGFNLYQIP